MSKTWVLVAHRAGGRIIASSRFGGPLDVVHDIDHPDGRLHAADIDTDRQGQSFDSSSAGPHAMVREEKPPERIAAEFARELAGLVDQARQRGEFERLVLVAPPRFLGRLRSALSRPTADLVVASVAKDLPDAAPESVRALLRDDILF